MSTVRARPRLIAVWVLLAVLIAFIVIVQHNGGMATTGSDDDEHGHASEGTRWLMPAPIDQLGAIEVVHEGKLHRFERDGAGAWLYHGAHGAREGAHEHRSDPAAAERIGQALTVLGRTRVERSLPLEASVAGDYGVATPSVVVLVYAPGSVQPWVQYAVGGKTPDGYARYVLPVGRSTVVTIANYQITGLLELIEDVASAKG